jgi:hypothetical protein
LAHEALSAGRWSTTSSSDCELIVFFFCMEGKNAGGTATDVCEIMHH